MVFLTIFTLVAPISMSSLSMLPDLDDISLLQIGAISLSSLLGFGIGALLYFNPDRQPMKFPFPLLQQLLEQDFYIEKIYQNTVVGLIYQLSQLTAWVDRYVIEGLVNSVGVATIFGSEGLKYGTSGQVQSYFFTITVGAGALGLMVVWLFW